MLVTISPARMWFLKPTAKEIGMIGMMLEYGVGLFMLPWNDDLLEGPAPRGSLERQMERLLRGLSIEDDDDDELL